jgi:RNA polymerase sigma factor (sigma-70 family)
VTIALSDTELLDRFLRGDAASEAAFAVLVARHGPMVLRVCQAVLDQREDAHDAYQATLLVLARKARSIRKRRSVAGWLYGVARRVSAKAKVAAARRRVHERRAAVMAAQRLDDAGPSASWSELHEEVDRLPPHYREAIVLCYLDGHSVADAARQIGRPVRSVETRLARARQRLSSRLVRRGLAPAVALLGVAAQARAAATPAVLDAATAKLAVGLASKGITAGNVSATVVELMKGALKEMALIRVKLAVVVALGLGAAGIGVGVIGHAVTVASAADDLKGDLARLQGRWQSEHFAGGVDMTLDVKGKTITITSVRNNADGVEYTVIEEAALKVDETANPKTMDWVDVELKNEPPIHNPPPPPFIYKIEGNTLTLCGGHNESSPRPSEFKEGGEGRNYTALVVFKRP